MSDVKELLAKYDLRAKKAWSQNFLTDERAYGNIVNACKLGDGDWALEIGGGLGTDWVQFARQGAVVVVCCASAEDLGLIRRNFELRGLSGRFLHSSPLNLPLDNASIDVVCLGDVLTDATDPRSIVDEIFRVLKPGGKVLALAPAYYDVNYWYHAFFPWLLDIFGGRQSARSIHFISATLIVAFVAIHLIEVVLAGPINEVRSMLGGR